PRKSCPVRAAGNAVGPAGDVLPLEHAFLKNRALLVATAESTSSQRSIGARQKLYRLDHLEHGKTPAVTAIERGRDAAAAQIRQRIGILAHEIGHMNIVSNAGAVRCRVVGAEDIHFWPQAERGFDRDLDEVGSSFARLADATERIGAGDIEITQD